VHRFNLPPGRVAVRPFGFAGDVSAIRGAVRREGTDSPTGESKKSGVRSGPPHNRGSFQEWQGLKEVRVMRNSIQSAAGSIDRCSNRSGFAPWNVGFPNRIQDTFGHPQPVPFLGPSFLDLLAGDDSIII